VGDLVRPDDDAAAPDRGVRRIETLTVFRNFEAVLGAAFQNETTVGVSERKNGLVVIYSHGLINGAGECDAFAVDQGLGAELFRGLEQALDAVARFGEL